jgi:lipoic acid synthetase
MEERSVMVKRLPRWIRTQLPTGEKYSRVKNLIVEHDLHTICTSGNCPNKGECWSAGTASFMILGENCTRNCRFCAVKTVKPNLPDWGEPERLAKSIKTLNLKHCVITSVARDDLADGGAAFWVETIRQVKKLNPNTTMEVLIPDFQGRTDLIQQIIDEKPEVISHNLETVRRLTPRIRSMATYKRSLQVLKYISSSGIIAKSGIMLGIGEMEREVFKAMDDLYEAGVKVLTIGQYLQPSSYHYDVQEYITPEQFKKYKQAGLERGFKFVESSPLVRSSYHAERHVKA